MTVQSPGATHLALQFPAHVAMASLTDWSTHVAQALRDGHRLLSLFGRHVDAHAPSDVLVTAVLLTPHGLRVLHGQPPAGAHYPALSPPYPGAQLLTRALWE